MPFLVVKCTSCEKFQVKQQVKAQKYSCAVCGQKQPLQRVYAISDTAKECRLKVQELSMGFGEAKEAKEVEACARTEQLEQAYAEAEEQGLLPEWGPECLLQEEQQQAGYAGSRWLDFAAAAEQEEGDQLQAEEDNEEDLQFVTRMDAPAPARGRVHGARGDRGRQGSMSRKQNQGEKSRPSGEGDAARCDDQGDHSWNHWGRVGKKRDRAGLDAWNGEGRRLRQGYLEQQQDPQEPLLPPPSFLQPNSSLQPSSLQPPSSLHPPCIQQQRQHLIAAQQLPHPILHHQAHVAPTYATSHRMHAPPPHQHPHTTHQHLQPISIHILAPPPNEHRAPLASIPARSNAASAHSKVGQAAPMSASSCVVPKGMPRSATAPKWMPQSASAPHWMPQSGTAQKWIPLSATARGSGHGERGAVQGMVGCGVAGVQQPWSGSQGHGEQGSVQGVVGHGGAAGVWQPWLGGARVQGEQGVYAGHNFQVSWGMAGSVGTVDGNKGNNAGMAGGGLGRIAVSKGVGDLGGGIAQARGGCGRGGIATSKWGDFLDGSDDVENGGKEEEEEEGGFVTAL